MKEIYISILMSVYLIYMFLFFQTSVDFNFGAESPNGWWYEHLVGDERGLRICPFGRVAIFVLIFVMIVRHYIKFPKYFIEIAFLISIILSLMNYNAVAYLLPIWIYELIIKNI
jgi:hypothetical protein